MLWGVEEFSENFTPLKYLYNGWEGVYPGPTSHFKNSKNDWIKGPLKPFPFLAFSGMSSQVSIDTILRSSPLKDTLTLA